ncbi:hypothetical protein ACFZDK_47685 [Streptomyces sp. NPDC007901]|uniref:hypothetical protein n=1 Tax=Streptomyces sp. NPDC007901 TaxID=3364785 RepID=UPI0036EE96E0
MHQMPALTAMMITLGSDLTLRQGRRGLAALLRASATPAHALVTFEDRSVVPPPRPGSPADLTRPRASTASSNSISMIQRRISDSPGR